jgi:diguanylate cyclase
VTRAQKYTMDEHDKISLISRVELFSSLIESDLAYVASRTGFRRVDPSTVLFSSGETASQFFIVTSGSVSITTKAEPYGQVEIARYVAGDVFGDFHFVINGAYDATAITCEKTELLVFPEDGFSFDRLSDEKPDTAARMLLRSISMIETRITSTKALIGENTPWIRELRKQIFTDPPTGLWNKTFMDSELFQQLSGTVAVLMIKPDRFKEINDAFGHAVGDEILKKLAMLLMAISTRDQKGWAIRLRSNEMCLVVPESSRTSGMTLAKEIQTALSGIRPTNGDEKSFALTASIGLGFWPGDNENWNFVADQTNEVMQTTWKNGGNRITLLRER